MRIKFYATLRLKVGQTWVDIPVSPGATVYTVLTDLTARYPILHEFIWDKEGDLVEFVHVLVNGRNVRYLSGLDTPIQPDDTIDIFPPVGGG